MDPPHTILYHLSESPELDSINKMGVAQNSGARVTRVLVFGSIYQGGSFEPQPNGCTHQNGIRRLHFTDPPTPKCRASSTPAARRTSVPSLAQGWLAGWLAGWLGGWLAGWLAGWLPGWVVGWLAGRLVGWDSSLAILTAPVQRLMFARVFRLATSVGPRRSQGFSGSLLSAKLKRYTEMMSADSFQMYTKEVTTCCVKGGKPYNSEPNWCVA